MVCARAIAEERGRLNAGLDLGVSAQSVEEAFEDRTGVFARRYREWLTGRPKGTYATTIDKMLVTMGLNWWDVYDPALWPQLTGRWRSRGSKDSLPMIRPEDWYDIVTQAARELGGEDV
jgi:hypothetical protein